jgi:hypothetical protein
MVRVHVRIDYITDRPIGSRPHASAQAASHQRAAARVNDGDVVVADDEAAVGDVSLIVGGDERVPTLVDEHARRDLGQGEPGLGRAPLPWQQWRG